MTTASHIPVLTFFNNKGGVGKTSLVYHLSWMFAELGLKVLAVDLDPQANLTAAFLSEDTLESLWSDSPGTRTTYAGIKPLLDVGDFDPVSPQTIHSNLLLLPGDLALAGYEDSLALAWADARQERNLARPFRILTAFWRMAQRAATDSDIDLILFDVGPNLGAINRAALLATDHVVVPLGADLFSLQGLRNLGPWLREWRSGWKTRLAGWKDPDFALPTGTMSPLGYIAMRHGARLSRPVKAYTRWLMQIPEVFRESVLEESASRAPDIEQDKYCIAMLKDYASLMPLSQEARKPMFLLRPADGAIGAHASAVRRAYGDFEQVAKALAKKLKLRLPS